MNLTVSVEEFIHETVYHITASPQAQLKGNLHHNVITADCDNEHIELPARPAVQSGGCSIHLCADSYNQCTEHSHKLNKRSSAFISIGAFTWTTFNTGA